MKRREFLRAFGMRFAIGLVLVGLLLYIVLHIFTGSSASLVTTPVRSITDMQMLRGVGYTFRDETVLTSTTLGLVDAQAESGSKVGQGVELVRVWSVDEAARAEQQAVLDRLGRLERMLEDSLPGAGDSLSSANAYRQQADDTFLELCRQMQEGWLAGVNAAETEMLVLLNRYRSLVLGTGDVEAALEAVRNEKNALLTGSVVSVVNQPRSGYFYDRGTVDGLESKFTASVARSLTGMGLEALLREAPAATEGMVLGKMAYGYEWYLAVTFSGEIDLFEVGTVYTVSFPENANRTLPLSCERVLHDLQGETVVLLRSDVTPADFDYLRCQSVEITTATTEGYYIPYRALQNVNGVEGVFIFEESTVCFRRIERLLEGDGYVIAARTEGEEGYLRQNDVMILSGKKLYDGKVYR